MVIHSAMVPLIVLCIALITLSLVRAADDHDSFHNPTVRASSPSEALIDWSTVQEKPSSLLSASTPSKPFNLGILHQRKLTDEQIRAKNRQSYLKVKNDPKKSAIERERTGMRYHKKKVEQMAKENKWTKEELNAELEKRMKERKERIESRDKRRQRSTKTDQGP